MSEGMKKAAIIALGNAIIVLLCVMLLLTGALKVLSGSMYDFQLRQSMSHAPHGDIVVVGIDTLSLKEMGPYPWDRKLYAELIRQLESAGAKVIAFDIEFYTDGANPESDRALADELAKHDNIIFPSHAVLENDFVRSTKVKAGEMLTAAGVEQPIPMFREHVHKAHINAAIDADGAMRSNWLFIRTPEGAFPTLALAAAQLAGVPVDRYLDPPLMDGRPKGELLIGWDATERDFETVPFVHVLDGQIPAEAFKDRIVLVGYTAPGDDQGVTPVERNMHLVYAHANILDQILKGRMITVPPKALPLLLTALFMALAGWLTWRLKAIAGIVSVFALLAVLLAGQFAVFRYASQYWDLTEAAISGLLAYTGNMAIKTYFETKQKNYITRQFGRYLSPDLVREIARSGQEIRLGGVSKELTILFLDVRGFTSLSEKLKPEEVVDLLNLMFNLVTERALGNRGTIDKFIGDAAMILFNAPLDVEDHPQLAVKTAYEIMRGMERVRSEVQDKYGVSISCGIGVHTGEAVVGNIGSYLRVDYTAIGDSVNTAARIESNTESGQILVSEATYERTKHAFDYEFVGEKLMKGKSWPVKLYEVKGTKGAS